MSQNSILLVEEDELVKRLERLAKKIKKKVLKKSYWVTKNIYREKTSSRDVLDQAMTAAFEAVFENPEASEKDLVVLGVKKYNTYLWGKGTCFYEKSRRSTENKNRAKLLADHIVTTPWGEEVNSYEVVADGTHEIDFRDIGKLFENLENLMGPELATAYVLHYAYRWPLTQITENIFGLDEETKDFQKIKARLTRFLKRVEGKLEPYAGRQNKLIFNGK